MTGEIPAEIPLTDITKIAEKIGTKGLELLKTDVIGITKTETIHKGKNREEKITYTLNIHAWEIALVFGILALWEFSHNISNALADKDPIDWIAIISGNPLEYFLHQLQKGEPIQNNDKMTALSILNMQLGALIHQWGTVLNQISMKIAPQIYEALNSKEVKQ
jgi:hypothetical protein